MVAWVFTALPDLFSARHDYLLNFASYITLDNLSLSKRRGRKELLLHDSLQQVEKTGPDTLKYTENLIPKVNGVSVGSSPYVFFFFSDT